MRIGIKGKNSIKALIHNIYRVGYWVLPPILLYFILKRIDFSIFFQTFSNVNIGLLILGVSYYPAVVCISGFRWQIALSEYFRIQPSLIYLIRHYWIGMALGFFSPGQIGLDAYRVIIIGKHYLRHMQMIFAILVEKMMALLNAVLLVICLYPFVKQLILEDNAVLDNIISISYFVVVSTLGLAGLVVVVSRQKLLLRFVDKISEVILRFINKIKGKVETETAEKDAKNISKILALMSKPKPFIYVFFASLAIQFVSALGNQIIFHAIGYEIPFIVNFFVSPIFYFLFLLPISFGSLGIREGSYILLYGIFGVPPEQALLVSFINLSGILFNNAVGAMLIWGSPKEKIET